MLTVQSVKVVLFTVALCLYAKSVYTDTLL